LKQNNYLYAFLLIFVISTKTNIVLYNLFNKSQNQSEKLQKKITWFKDKKGIWLIKILLSY
jgi:predicted 3-demethylubiquinone-9 3-methyltransferase (glyoxalase superfamily)